MKISQQKNSGKSYSKAIILTLSLFGAYGLYKLVPTTDSSTPLTHAAEGDTISEFAGTYSRTYQVTDENTVTYEYKGSQKTSTIKYRWSHGYCGGTDGHLYFFKSKYDHKNGFTWTGKGEMTEVTGLDELCYNGAFWRDRWYFETKDYHCYYWSDAHTKKFVDCVKARSIPEVEYAEGEIEVVDLALYGGYSPFTFDSLYRDSPTYFEFDKNGLPDDIGYVTSRGTFIPKRFDDVEEKTFLKSGTKHYITSPYGGYYYGYDEQGSKVKKEFVFKRWVPASDQFEDDK